MKMGVQDAPRYHDTLMSLEYAFSAAVYVWEYEEAKLHTLESTAKAAAEKSHVLGMRLIDEFRDIIDQSDAREKIKSTHDTRLLRPQRLSDHHFNVLQPLL